MKSLFLITLVSLLPAFASASEDGYNSLQAKVQAKFLGLANDANADLGKELRKVNEENTDGRNQDGVFKFPFTADSIRIVPMGGENGFGAYCHQNEKDESLDCETVGITENYLVLVTYRMGVHKAGEIMTLSYKMTAFQQDSWHEDKDGKQSDKKTELTLSNPQATEITFGN